jgi:multimeric flavodoxin WrbA
LKESWMRQPVYLLIDGTEHGDEALVPIFSLLYDTLSASGVNIETLALRNLKLGHCVGCFGCWLKTPGQCIQKDSGPQILQAILRSDAVILFGRVMFGTYSPKVKRLIDRCLSPLNLPYLKIAKGETHHQPRYDRSPRWMCVGVQGTTDSSETMLFKLIAGRNALQVHASSHAVSVVSVTDSAERIQYELKDLLTRTDPFPNLSNLDVLLPTLSPASIGVKPAASGKRALLITGSPKAKPSTSAALGNYLTQRLEKRCWQVETLKLHPRLQEHEKHAQLLEAIDRTDLIILAFPLYNDSPPYLVTYALQLIAAWRLTPVRTKPQHMMVIVNNGFPEPHHNLPAVAVCRRFAEECRLHWAGGLIVGGGEALSGGRSLPEIKRVLPPVRHVMRALDLAAANLSEGKPLPSEATRLISRNPIYPAPFSSYCWIFRRVAARRWEREAATNGLTPDMLYGRPFMSA